MICESLTSNCHDLPKPKAELAGLKLHSNRTIMAQKTLEKKPLLLLVPHYVGSLRYFEKLLPHLAGRYDVRFLLIFGRRSFGEMTVYAREHNSPFIAINPPKYRALLRRLPLYVTIRNAVHYSREVEKMLRERKPARIVATNDQGFYMRRLIEEANRRGVDTAVLQWALTYPGQRIRPQKQAPLWRKHIYRIGKPLYIHIRDNLLKIALGNDSRWHKGIIGGGSAKRFGVINKQALEWFKARGVPAEKMTVVGYLDFHLSKEINEEFCRDASKKEEAAKRHNIDLKKKNIIFYSTPFNRKDTAILTDEEQRRMTETLVRAVRDICPKDEYGLLFKPHPSETKEQYSYLSPYSVSFMDPLADNSELIALSDLYIAGVSTTNFIPISMDKDAVFVNLAKLPQVESARPFFGIKKFVTEPAELHLLLNDFKRGNLERQYEGREKIITDESLEKILNWIG